MQHSSGCAAGQNFHPGSVTDSRNRDREYQLLISKIQIDPFVPDNASPIVH